MGVRAAYSREQYEADQLKAAEAREKSAEFRRMWWKFCDELGRRPAKTMWILFVVLFRRVVIPLAAFALGWVLRGHHQ